MHSLFCIQYTVSILTVTQKCPYTKMPIRDRMHPAGQEEVHCVLGRDTSMRMQDEARPRALQVSSKGNFKDRRGVDQFTIGRGPVVTL